MASASETTPLRCAPGRVTIDGETYKKDGKEIVLMGGNYVMKAMPYYPPLDVVKKDAKLMAEGAKKMAYTPPPAADGSARAVVPCVRLGALMEAAMPRRGSGLDASFTQKLEATVKAFQEEGVHVFLDMHQDAYSTTNGGEGYPWWVAADFQKRAGCCFEQCCCCCCFAMPCFQSCPESCRTSYLANPNHPLQPFCCLPSCFANCCGCSITTYSEDSDPWRPYSVGGDAGDPVLMNAGNASMRQNNADGTWSSLITSAQVQNCVPRLYASAHNREDKALFFDPFVAFCKYLCGVWDKYDNVIAVELMNEPPFGGLPNIFKCSTTWRRVLSFQSDVLAALDEDPSIKCPIAIGNWSNAVENESCCVSCLQWSGISADALKRFQSYANQNRLILSFHWYVPPSTVTMRKNIELAIQNAAKFGGVPIYLSEYWMGSTEAFAVALAIAADHGCNATTYWQYADTEFTGQPGWYKYPPSVLNAGNGSPVNSSGQINTAAWNAYSTTVADGEIFGAAITGGRGAVMNVLERVPAKPILLDDEFVPKWPGLCTCFFSKPRRAHVLLD